MSRTTDEPLVSIFIIFSVVFLLLTGAVFGAASAFYSMEKDWQKKMDAGLIRVFDEKSESYIWTKAKQ